MRDTSPLSFFGTSTSHALSFLRWITRRAFTPQLGDTAGKRSCEKGIADLERPALLVARHGRLPHGVPGDVLEVVVVERRVALDAGGAHLEHDAGAVVVVRVEEEREAVGLGGGVAPRELAGDRGPGRVGEPHARVERVVVEQQPQLGRLASPAGPARGRAAGSRRRPVPRARPPRRAGRPRGSRPGRARRAAPTPPPGGVAAGHCSRDRSSRPPASVQRARASSRPRRIS